MLWLRQRQLHFGVKDFQAKGSLIVTCDFMGYYAFSYRIPPNIDDTLTSSDVIVREGDNVTLRCKAKGSPEPSIRWRRDDGHKIVINKTMEVVEVDGEALELERISRLHMGAYLCIATNGVPPSVSKRINFSHGLDTPPVGWHTDVL
ncbi:unnamed protein product [Ceratitis capitata]|uniref:(Mediterranean fruit fly) hypothetical protein n=1 Tax=Ceratitis capitata TaxID=7213 RepID=A0A811UEZ3_CERCA|nr:unnamed protein product [Ceratitis capitata]